MSSSESKTTEAREVFRYTTADGMSGENRTTDALRHKLIADLYDLRVWERGHDRVVTPPWRTLTVEERDLIADALKQWKPA
jgi:hypothetical protein